MKSKSVKSNAKHEELHWNEIPTVLTSTYLGHSDSSPLRHRKSMRRVSSQPLFVLCFLFISFKKMTVKRESLSTQNTPERKTFPCRVSVVQQVCCWYRWREEVGVCTTLWLRYHTVRECLTSIIPPTPALFFSRKGFWPNPCIITIRIPYEV